MHLLAAAKNYAQYIKAPKYVDVIELFIKEQQRHRGDLVQFCVVAFLMQGDALALQGDALTLHLDALALQGDALTLHLDALALQGDTLTLSADALTLHLDALALQGIAKFNSLRINEMLYLGRFFHLAQIPGLQRNWGDTLFRKIRYAIPTMEIWTTPVIMVETLAVVYYKAIQKATNSPVLKQLCQLMQSMQLRWHELLEALWLLSQPIWILGGAIEN
ncbi:hypothetical protein [Nostoc sp.]|uniref:hypothetical protein n=1 Tax=Nostoc sp. TaxID=1180 RepID=UPI002FFB33BA